MDFKKELKILMKAKTQCIWIKSYEETKVIDEIISIVKKDFPSMTINSWSLFLGLKQEVKTKFEKETAPKAMPPDKVFKTIIAQQADENGDDKSSVFILKDFHSLKTNPVVTRGLRDVKEVKQAKIRNYNPVIIVSPFIDISDDLDKLFTVIEYGTPNKEEIAKLFSKYVEKLNEKKKETPSDRDLKECIDLARGLTLNEIKSFITRSIVEFGTIKKDIFLKARIELIRKTNILEYKECNLSMDDMGGNHSFKEWIEDIEMTFEDGAEEFGVEKSKGYLTIGPAGTAKTLSAEMVASKLRLPVLKLEMSKIMHSLVGSSERNMEKAINVLKACSPCVLFIDEIEKSLSGASGGQSDGGTMQRTFGMLLEYLSSPESKDTFTIMTSNDASSMPPELTRSGRLDTIWFFDLPNEEEREEILKIHFSKKGFELSSELLSMASSITENYSGAEIKELVKNSIRNAFKRYKETNIKKIEIEDIEYAMSNIIIVYNSSREKIMALREYSKNRARIASANKSENIKHIEDEYDDIITLEDM